MSRANHKFDRFFLILVVILILAGFFIFASASLGLLGKTGVSFTRIAVKQFTVLLGGLLVMFICAYCPYRTWLNIAPWLFWGGVILTALVFWPTLGVSAGGARRWLAIGSISFQPSEILKLGYIMYLAKFYYQAKELMGTWRHGLWPLIGLTSVIGILLLLQPDTDTFIVIAITGIAMFFVAGGKWYHLGLLLLIGMIGLGALVLQRPYLQDRLATFFDPSQGTLGTSYQINQSLIAIGSGGLVGRGFGQSIQKFYFLPEPYGDSIFAVAAEEFGLIGGIVLVSLFLLFSIWGLKIASRATDEYGRLLAAGIVILIGSQSFINMSAMLGLVPLTGIPLVFVSYGGTALLMAMWGTGIVLNISRR